MTNVIRLQSAPRTAARYEEPADVLIPALARLRQCRDGLDVLVYVDTLPDIILPALAWAASRKRYVPYFAVEKLVQYCGPAFLERCLGKARSRELLSRYPKRAALSGL